MTRALTALVLAPVTLAIVLLAPGWLFVLLLVALALLAAREFYDLMLVAGIVPHRRAGLLAVAVVVMGVSLADGATVAWVLAGVTAIVLAALLLCLAQPEPGGEPRFETLAWLRSSAAGTTVLGVLYPGLMVALLGRVRSDFSPAWLTWLLLVVWAGDVAAMYAGRQFGHRRLAPRVSPNKTLAGAVAALVAAAVVGWAAVWLLRYLGEFIDLGMWIPPSAPWLIGLALLISVAAQAGDLVESVFKRAAGVKDSGTLVPGHGGVLDRIDALLFAAPVLWLCLLAMATAGARG